MSESKVEAVLPQPRIHARGVGEKDRLMSTLLDHRIVKKGRYDDVPVYNGRRVESKRFRVEKRKAPLAVLGFQEDVAWQQASLPVLRLIMNLVLPDSVMHNVPGHCDILRIESKWGVMVLEQL